MAGGIQGRWGAVNYSSLGDLFEALCDDRGRAIVTSVHRNSYFGSGKTEQTMGLFGGDSTDNEAQTLATDARGESVTPDRLTKTEGGFMEKDLLDTDPVITYLGADEQPHYFLYNDSKGITRDGKTAGGGNDASFRSLCLVTDERILFFTAGSKGEALPLDAITGVDPSAGRMKHRLTVETPDHEYTFYINNTIAGEEVMSCGEYIGEHAQQTTAAAERAPTTVIDGLSALWNDELDETPSVDDALDADPQGSYVTTKRYEKIKGILDPDERIHFLTRGSTVDVEGSSAGESLFGDNRSRKSGTRGWVRAVITDKRVAIKIPQVLGTDQRSVPYTSLTSVDLDTGLVNKRLTLQTPGQTYHIEAHEPGKDEVRRAIRFIRQQVAAANEPNVVQQAPAESDPDPLEQIEKLQELHETGAISDAEFEAKKQDLLDKI